MRLTADETDTVSQSRRTPDGPGLTGPPAPTHRRACVGLHSDVMCYIATTTTRLKVLAGAAAFAVALAGCGGGAQQSQFKADVAQICARELRAGARSEVPLGATPMHARQFVEARLGAAAPDIQVLRRTAAPTAVEARFKAAVLELNEEQSQLANIIQSATPSETTTQATVATQAALSQFEKTTATAHEDWSSLALPDCGRFLDIPNNVLLLAAQGAPHSAAVTPPRPSAHRRPAKRQK
jgi:hypothetical protein